MNPYSNLHILADFDWTLTFPYTDEWVRIPWIIAILKMNKRLGEEHARRATELFEYYWPLEHDPLLSKEEKVPLMTQRRSKMGQLLIDCNLNKSHIEQVIHSWQVRFRSWWEEFFWFLQKNSIPLTIYSASSIWSEAIKQFLHHHSLPTELINIVSNDYIRDNAWNATSIEWNIMHTYNKDTFKLSDHSWFDEQLQNRKQALILWDSLWDIDIGKTASFDTVTSVWFLNKKDPDQDSLKAYETAYDHLFWWDQWFDEVMGIIAQISPEK